MFEAHLREFCRAAVGFAVAVVMCGQQLLAEPLPGTAPLEMTGDIASHLVGGVDRFLLRQIEYCVAQRQQHWQRDFSSSDAYQASMEPSQQRLAHLLGLRDDRAENIELRLLATTSQPALVGRGDGYEVRAVSWPAFGDVTGRGLLLEPVDRVPVATVVALADCEVLPEQLAGLLPGVSPQSQYARRLAENGCRVIVPLLINRQDHLPGLTNREWLYRSAFELGRGLVAYEVQKVLALVDWASSAENGSGKIGVMGWGEGRSHQPLCCRT